MENVDWDHIRKYAHANAPTPPSWPSGVRPISMQGLGLLGLDDNYRLYWDGKPVEMKYRLTFWQTIGAFVVGTSVVVGSIAAVVQAWTAFR
jgi:hypothetical protein